MLIATSAGGPTSRTPVNPTLPTTMPDPTPLEQTIADNAQGPKKAQGDAGSVEQHSLPDQIAADRYLASKRAVRSRGKGIVISKIIPPGAA